MYKLVCSANVNSYMYAFGGGSIAFSISCYYIVYHLVSLRFVDGSILQSPFVPNIDQHNMYGVMKSIGGVAWQCGCWGGCWGGCCAAVVIHTD